MANQLNALLVFGGDSTKAVNEVKRLANELKALRTSISSVEKTSKTTGQSGLGFFQRWMPVLKGIGGSIKNVVDGFRLMTQGLMSIGRAMTFFVSIPLVLFLKTAATEAIDFEDRMVRVSKTTGIAGIGLKELENGLRAVARSAPTSHEQLAIMAEQAGQLGLKAKDSILSFVRWMEILATSTDISKNEVVSIMGQISAAFGKDIDKSTDFVIRLANSMNMLENTTASSANQIATGLKKFASEAATLKIHAADATALVAALVSLGVSADATGTRLSRMFIQLVQNADTFAELASGTEKYATQMDVLNAINEDAVGVLFDLILMMHEEENSAVALAEAFDITGLVGGRALGRLAGNAELVRGALERSRKEWGDSTSLITEYNRALESSKNHLQILRNNISDVGMTLGNTLLPVLNDIIELLIPAFRKLNVAFQQLTKAQQMWIVGGAAALVVFGPLAFMVSQVTFGFSMMGLGLIKLVSAVGGLIGSFKILLGLLGAIGGFVAANPVVLLIGGIVAAAAILLTNVGDIGTKIAEFFLGLADSARAWGEKLIQEYAQGLVNAVGRFIVTAMNWVGKIISNYLAARSPPKEGMLKQIGEWGSRLIDEYFKGMTKGNFGILSNLSSIIGKLLKNLFAAGKIGEKQQFTFLIQARKNLAKLLTIWNDTGEISNKVLNDIVKHLGNAGDELKKLILLNIKYLEIQQKISDLQRRREAFIDSIEEEIEATALSGKTAEERVAIIRDILARRNAGLREMAAEEESLEAQRDIAQEQLETQKALVDALGDTDDILAQLVRTLERLSEAGGGGGGDGFEFPPIDPEGLGIDEVLGELGKLVDPIIALEERLKSKGGVIDLLMMGLRGEPLGFDVDDPRLRDVPLGERRGAFLQDEFGITEEDVGLALRLFEIGTNIHNTWMGIKQTWSDAKAFIIGLVEGVKGLDPSRLVQEGGALEGPLEGIKKFIQGVQNFFQPLADFFSNVFGAALEAITPGLDRIKEVLASPEIREAIEKVIEIYKEFIVTFLESEKVKEILTDVGKVFSFFGKIVGFVIGGAIGLIASFINAFLTGFATYLEVLAGIINGSDDIVEIIQGIITAGFAGILATIGGFVEGALTFFVNFVDDLVTGPGAKFAIEFYDQVVTALGDILDEIGTFVVDAWNEFKEWKDNVIGTVVEFFGDIGSKIDTWTSETLTTFFEWAKSIPEKIKEGIEQTKADMLAAFGRVINDLLGKFSPLVDVINQVLKFAGTDIQIPTGVTNPPPELASGGITTGPTFAMIGEAGPEAVIPLGKLGHILGRLHEMNSQGARYIIENMNFDVGSVRSDQDLKRIAEEVKKVLDTATRNRLRYSPST